jgi:ankyrin repeat protein
MAVANGHVKTALLLLEHGASVLARTVTLQRHGGFNGGETGETAFHRATSYRGHAVDRDDAVKCAAAAKKAVDMAAMLLRYGADVDSLGINGGTALWHAAARNPAVPQIITLLLKAGANRHFKLHLNDARALSFIDRHGARVSSSIFTLEDHALSDPTPGVGV